MFFPIWMLGCFAALIINIRDWRMWGLTAFYFFFAIALFQIKFDGMAVIYGWKWYVLVSLVQIFVIGMTYITYARAAKSVRQCGFGIIGVCMLYLPFYVLHHPLPKAGYFIGINTFQALQVLALIGYSPSWTWVGKKLKAVIVHARSRAWLRTASGRI